MATARCTGCGKTMQVSAQQKRLLKLGIKVVNHRCGGKFK
jgi:hypothetical protein